MVPRLIIQNGERRKRRGKSLENVILGDPGEVSGARKVKTDGRIKKSQEREEDPTGNKGQFQTVGIVLASDWCQKAFVFFFPQSQSSKGR